MARARFSNQSNVKQTKLGQTSPILNYSDQNRTRFQNLAADTNNAGRLRTNSMIGNIPFNSGPMPNSMGSAQLMARSRQPRPSDLGAF